MMIRMGRSKWPVVAGMALLIGSLSLSGCGGETLPGADKVGPAAKQEDIVTPTKTVRGASEVRSIKNRPKQAPTP